MLELCDVTKRYGALTAVSHLSFAVKPGEVLGYLGPNGSGKSTTVKRVLAHFMSSFAADARSAIERTLFAFGVLPVALLFVPLYWTLWGPQVALTHLLVSLGMGVLLIEVALLRFSGMPCARPWNPDGVNLGRWLAAYVLGFLVFTGGVPALELLLFGHPLATAFFVSDVIIAALAVRIVSLRKRLVVQNDPGAFAPGDILSLN